MKSSQPSKRHFNIGSIKVKLSAVLLLLTVIPLSGLTLFFTNYFSGVTKTDSQRLQETTAELNIDRLNEWMQLKISAMEALIVSHPEFKAGKPEQLIPLLKIVDDSDNQINGFNLIDLQGNAIDTNGVEISVADREYFKKVLETKQPVVSDMLLSKKTGKYVLPLGVPILDDAGNLTGLLSASVSPETLVDLTAAIRIAETGYGFILSGEGDYYAHPDMDRIGKKAEEYEKSASAQTGLQTMKNQQKGSVEYTDGSGKKVISYFDTIPGTSWKLVVSAPVNEVYAAVSKAQTISYVVVAGFLVVIVLLAVWISMIVVRPILSVSGTMTEVANGNLTGRVNVRSRDEIGEMGVNINAMIDSLAEVVRKIDRTVDQVSYASGALLQSSEQSSDAASHIASSIQEVASGAETQLQGAEQSALAMEEMATGIQRIAQSSSFVSDQTGDVANRVESGYSQIHAAIEQMNVIGQAADHSKSVITQLNERSGEIGHIIDVISDIANQTALLSLNASIEAARAGEQGRGFAVVANEVKKLAEQTNESVSSIASIIQSIRHSSADAAESMEKNMTEIQEGIDKIQQVGEVFEAIRSAVHQVSDQIQEVSATTEQISAGTEEITASIGEMVSISQGFADNSQSVASSAEQQSASMASIASLTKSLNQMMAELKETIRMFKVG